MCMRLLRDTIKHRCPEARSAVAKILGGFSDKDATMNCLITSAESVVRDRSAWASFLKYLGFQVWG
jgi:hypothetical protein